MRLKDIAKDGVGPGVRALVKDCIMDVEFPFDPLEHADRIEQMVMQGEKRIYSRFRASCYYGGIATADAVGCSFLCAYCWNYDRNLRPEPEDTWYTPQSVAVKLFNVARTCSYNMYRLSGSEPLLGPASFQHLLQVVKTLVRYSPNAIFVLETNGLFLGDKPEFIQSLLIPNLRVRVCLKGIDEKSFETISGAKREYFYYPLIALQEMEKAGITAWPALMGDFFREKEITEFQLKLKTEHVRAELELENLEAYPPVVGNLKKRKIEF